MEPINALGSPSNVMMGGEESRTDFCLAEPGQVYLIYSMHGDSLTLDIVAERRYNATQMNTRTGRKTDMEQVDEGRHKFSLTDTDQALVLKA